MFRWTDGTKVGKDDNGANQITVNAVRELNHAHLVGLSWNLFLLCVKREEVFKPVSRLLVPGWKKRRSSDDQLAERLLEQWGRADEEEY